MAPQFMTDLFGYKTKEVTNVPRGQRVMEPLRAMPTEHFLKPLSKEQTEFFKTLTAHTKHTQETFLDVPCSVEKQPRVLFTFRNLIARVVQ